LPSVCPRSRSSERGGSEDIAMTTLRERHRVA
jgi:hypothetical protein